MSKKNFKWMETRSWNESKILLQTSASMLRPRHPTSRIGGLGRASCVLWGYGAKPQPKLKLV